MADKPIPEESVSKADLPARARWKCPKCGAYGLNKQIECTGFGGDPGDDRLAHAPVKMVLNPDREDR